MSRNTKLIKRKQWKTKSLKWTPLPKPLSVFSLKQTLGEPLEEKITVWFQFMPNMKNLKETITDVVTEANVTYSFTQDEKDEYDTNYKQYTSGKMSKDEWIKYTTALLNKIMEVNKDVLVRLKNR